MSVCVHLIAIAWKSDVRYWNYSLPKPSEYAVNETVMRKELVPSRESAE